MNESDYEGMIRSLSSAYETRNRVGHDTLLASFKGQIPETQHQILTNVIGGYFAGRNANNRLFGAFPERDIRELTKKCNELEASFNIPLRQAS
jgi:hypothetical protein